MNKKSKPIDEPSQVVRITKGSLENRFRKILVNGAHNPSAKQLSRFDQHEPNQLSWLAGGF